MEPVANFSAYQADLWLAGPEIVMSLGAMVLLMIGAFRGDRATPIITGLSIATIVIAMLWLLWLSGQGTAFNAAFTLDPFAIFMKTVALVGSAVALAMASARRRSSARASRTALRS